MTTMTSKREEITQGIVEMVVRDLEKGTCPWERPFAGAGLPVNASTGKRYRGINILILWGEVMRRGFGATRWMTYHQALQAGGYVKRGEIGTPVIFYSPVVVADRGIDGKVRVGTDGREITKSIRLLRFYRTFNIEQCGGVERMLPMTVLTFVPVDEAEKVMVATGAKIQHADCGKAFYDPDQDRVVLPPRGKFQSVEGFYGTAFHELAHWTGASSRLNRHPAKMVKGDRGYAFEELVAELGAAFACAHLGMPYDTQHASYIESWLQALKEEPKVLFRAAAKAQEACDFILGINQKGRDEEPGG